MSNYVQTGFWCGVLILAAIVLLAALYETAQPTLDRYEWAELDHTVDEGETLWSIAHIYCPEDVNCQEWIDRIEELNRIENCLIRAGDIITVLIPIGKEK